MSKASEILYNLVNHTFDPALRNGTVWQWLVHPSNQKEKEEALLSIWNEYPTGANAETYHSLKTTQRKIRENQSPSKQYNLVHKLLRIAAILIIPLLSIAGSYLYIKQNTYNTRIDTMFRSGRRKSGRNPARRFHRSNIKTPGSILIYPEKIQRRYPHTLSDGRGQLHRKKR